MAKSSDRMDNALLALTTFTDRLYRVAKPEAQRMEVLMRDLRLAAGDERERYDQLRAKYETAKEDISDLKREVRHLERGSARSKDRERKSRDKEDSREKYDEERRSRRKSRRHSHRDRDDRRRHEPSAPDSHDKRGEGRSVDRRGSEHIDSYDSKSEQPSSRKRKHRRSSSASSMSNPFSTSHLPRFPERKPICGSCHKHGTASTCDSGISCANCDDTEKLVCCYWLCPAGAACEKGSCAYLHPEQWDIELENGARKVSKLGNTKVSGFGDEYFGVLK